jgi:homoserine O-acetyltransferase
VTAQPPYELFEAGPLDLANGGRLPAARLAYRLRGPANAPLVMTTTAFGATPADLAYLKAPGAALDPARVRLLEVEQLGAGRSTSPSNAAPPLAGPAFPPLSIRDDVALQARLLDRLGLERVDAVVGASMGGQQAVLWAVSHPGRVRRAVAIAANARTTLYARLFLHAVASALRSDPAFAEGAYAAPPLLGLSRLSETWAAFALSPRFFSTGRHLGHADMAAADLDGFLAKWRTRYHDRDANDLLVQIAKWAAFDVADAPGCASFEEAAARAALPVLFLPISTDLYFHPDDVRDQAAAFPEARVETIESLSGHAAAFGREATDREAIDARVAAFLDFG